MMSGCRRVGARGEPAGIGSPRWLARHRTQLRRESFAWELLLAGRTAANLEGRGRQASSRLLMVLRLDIRHRRGRGRRLAEFLRPDAQGDVEHDDGGDDGIVDDPRGPWAEARIGTEARCRAQRLPESEKGPAHTRDGARAVLRVPRADGAGPRGSRELRGGHEDEVDDDDADEADAAGRDPQRGGEDGGGYEETQEADGEHALHAQEVHGGGHGPDELHHQNARDDEEGEAHLLHRPSKLAAE
mmetsp:Transcript_6561/g.19457  ORF Transcript_6561/g.19457 Transcript_6561/m.19457 type:complete len:244 (+) Transcript_6561:182-913(+)